MGFEQRKLRQCVPGPCCPKPGESWLHDSDHLSTPTFVSPEAQEHDLVIKQLQPMDKTRKCYRMIGDVLVERTVAETLPAGQLQHIPLLTASVCS